MSTLYSTDCITDSATTDAILFIKKLRIYEKGIVDAEFYLAAAFFG